MLHCLADYYEACGENESALAYAHQQVFLEPWLEEGHRQVMRILALLGRRSEALAQYETCKRLLSSELGLEPAEETTRLYEAIRLDRLDDIQPGGLLPTPGQTPFKGLQYFDEADAALFFGRESLAERLAKRIQAMVTTSRGGAVELFPCRAGRFHDGFLYPGWSARGGVWQRRLLPPVCFPGFRRAAGDRQGKGSRRVMNNKILILKSSPRSRGNSATLADNLAEGAREAGAAVETVYLHGLDIRPCDACDLCKETGMYCAIEDDMQDLYPKLIEANAIVLASPVYWFIYSAQLKLCIDRWYGLWNVQPEALRGKQIGILLSYGDSDLETSGGINAVRTFESMFRFLRCEIVGIVHGSLSDPGDAEKNPGLLRAACDLGRRLAEKSG
jgi:NAD(P)H-dependent FMN reductase